MKSQLSIRSPQRQTRRVGIPSPRILLGIMAACCLATSCAPKTQPLALAGFDYTLDSSGLNQLIEQLPAKTASEQKQQLKVFCDACSAQDLKQKASYVLARVLQKSGSPEDLKESISAYQSALPFEPLAGRCRIHISECAQTLGDEKLARQTFDELIKSLKKKSTNSSTTSSIQPDQDLCLQTQYALGQSYMRTNEYQAARSVFSDILSSAPDSNYGLGATYYLAQIDLFESGVNATPGNTTETIKPVVDESRVARAVAGLRHYLQSCPDGRFAIDIVSQIQKLVGAACSIDDHNLFARAYFANGHYRSALEEWKKAGNTVDWYKQAVCLLRLGQTADAKNMIHSGIAIHPQEDSVPAAAGLVARYSNREGAIAIWQLVEQKCPKFRDDALYNLATRAASTEAAIGMYLQIVNKYPTSAFAPEASWWLAWKGIQSGHAKEALALLEQSSVRYASSKAQPRFLYWIGKLHEKLGQKEAAVAAYERTASNAPWHYYAHRAQSRLKALNAGQDRGWRTNPQRRVTWVKDTTSDWRFPEPPATLAKEEGPTIEALTELRQWDECLNLVPTDKGLLKAFYLAKMNVPLEAINAAGKALHGRPENSESWQLSYPLLYARFVAREAAAKQVDPLLVQALIREESRYNAQAISSSHALGLMQLLPGTALGVAKRLGVKITSNADIHEPRTNIQLGVDYLSYVLKRFNGNALFAVASYNGGPNAVQRWSANMPADTDVFVENIPYRETRDYVRKVFGSYWDYEAVYGPQAEAAN